MSDPNAFGVRAIAWLDVFASSKHSDDERDAQEDKTSPRNVSNLWRIPTSLEMHDLMFGLRAMREVTDERAKSDAKGSRP